MSIVKSLLATTAVVSLLSVSSFAAPAAKKETKPANIQVENTTTVAPAATTTAPAAATTAPAKKY